MGEKQTVVVQREELLVLLQNRYFHIFSLIKVLLIGLPIPSLPGLNPLPPIGFSIPPPPGKNVLPNILGHFTSLFPNGKFVVSPTKLGDNSYENNYFSQS